LDSDGNEKDKKKIECSARVCTSIISLSQKVLDMGDCLIGTTQVCFFFIYFSK